MDISINLNQHKVYRGEKKIHLGPTEYKLLRHLMENPGRATDALIQKGLIYRTLGKEELAMIMFRDLLDDYPESDYARLVGMELNSVELY